MKIAEPFAGRCRAPPPDMWPALRRARRAAGAAAARRDCRTSSSAATLERMERRAARGRGRDRAAHRPRADARRARGGRRRSTGCSARSRSAGQSPARRAILHLHSTFDAGGKELRARAADQRLRPEVCARDRLGRARARSAPRAAIDPRHRGHWPDDFPALAGHADAGAAATAGAAMRGYDLV